MTLGELRTSAEMTPMAIHPFPALPGPSVRSGPLDPSQPPRGSSRLRYPIESDTRTHVGITQPHAALLHLPQVGVRVDGPATRMDLEVQMGRRCARVAR